MENSEFPAGKRIRYIGKHGYLDCKKKTEQEAYGKKVGVEELYKD